MDQKSLLQPDLWQESQVVVQEAPTNTYLDPKEEPEQNDTKYWKKQDQNTTPEGSRYDKLEGPKNEVTVEFEQTDTSINMQDQEVINYNEIHVQPMMLYNENTESAMNSLTKPDSPKTVKRRHKHQEPSTWQCNIRKLKHQKGEAYINRRAINIDTERLILEVRQRPALWDLSHELYKDKCHRAQLWHEISETLFPGYDIEDNREQHLIEKSIQQRWKTSRDAYMRCKNKARSQSSGSRGSRKKQYLFFNKLHFLDKNDPSNVEDLIPDTAPAPVTETIVHILDDVIIGEESKEQIDSNSCLTEDENSSDKVVNPPTYKRQRKRKSANETLNKEMLEFFKENAKIMKNDNLSFFMSLLPVTEKFSLHQKLLFRTEVLKKAMEIGGMQNPYDIPTSPNSSATLVSLSSGYDGIQVNTINTFPHSDEEIISQGYQNFSDLLNDCDQNLCSSNISNEVNPIHTSDIESSFALLSDEMIEFSKLE